MTSRQSIVVALITACLLSFLRPEKARAQTSGPPAPTQVQTSPKGKIGLGLLGAELGFVLPTAFGLKKPWSLALFPSVGAIGGAILGHVYIDQRNHRGASIALLSAGLAFIPLSAILTYKFTRYNPDDDDDNDDDDSESDDGESTAHTSSEYAGTGALRWTSNGWQIALPGFSVTAMYTQQELVRTGATQRAQFHFSLVSGAF